MRQGFYDVARHEGATLVIAGVLPQVRLMLERGGALERLGRKAVPETLRAAVDAHEIRAKRLDQVVPIK